MYVSFEVESMDVNENDGIISIFLDLNNVTGSTKDPIMIDVSSQEGTAGMVASKSAHVGESLQRPFPLKLPYFNRHEVQLVVL